jgi:hypothetical protein
VGCGHRTSFREPSCEWSKGGGQEARGTRAMDAKCGSGRLAWFFAFSAKTMTAWNAPHEATYLPEAFKTNSAEARSDPQASLTRQRLDFLAFAP